MIMQIYIFLVDLGPFIFSKPQPRKLSNLYQEGTRGPESQEILIKLNIQQEILSLKKTCQEAKLQKIYCSELPLLERCSNHTLLELSEAATIKLFQPYSVGTRLTCCLIVFLPSHTKTLYSCRVHPEQSFRLVWQIQHWFIPAF